MRKNKVTQAGKDLNQLQITRFSRVRSVRKQITSGNRLGYKESERWIISIMVFRCSEMIIVYYTLTAVI